MKAMGGKEFGNFLGKVGNGREMEGMGGMVPFRVYNEGDNAKKRLFSEQK